MVVDVTFTTAHQQMEWIDMVKNMHQRLAYLCPSLILIEVSSGMAKNKEVIMEEDFGELMCWHIVHCDCCKKDLLTKITLAPISEEIKEDIDTDDDDVTPGKEVTNKKKKKKRKAAKTKST